MTALVAKSRWLFTAVECFFVCMCYIEFDFTGAQINILGEILKGCA